ncbi:MAG: DUF5752 family protein [Nitrospiraceae bacterium]
MFPNDFATWVTLYAQDRLLGERLGVVDPFEFEDIEQLRGEIGLIIEDHLIQVGSIPCCAPEEPFEFVRSHIIESELDLEVRTLLEFRNVLAQVEVGAIYDHVCEAHVRKGRLPGDFACEALGGRARNDCLGPRCSLIISLPQHLTCFRNRGRP